MELSSTELFNANKEMKAQNQRLKELQMAAENLRHENELILNSVGEGIVRVNVEGKITFANPRAIAMAGCSEAEFVGKDLHDAMGHLEFGGNRCAGQSCNLTNVCRDGVLRRADNEGFARKDGEAFPVEYTAAPIRELYAIVGAVIVFKDITKRKKLESEYLDAAHQAGMAEIATGVIHNVGNILNSVNVSAEHIQKVARNSKVGFFKKANGLLQDNRAGWGAFLTSDPKGSKLPEYYSGLADQFTADFAALQAESEQLLKKIELIKHVVDVQQSYARGGDFIEPTSLQEAIESVLVIQQQAFVRHDIKVVKNLRSGAPVLAQKTKLIHVLLNLIKNATEAMVGGATGERRLTIETVNGDHGEVTIRIADTGSGVSAANLGKIFTHGFTTKQGGHGFGLHYCANALTEMGATISAESDGPGKGAAFIVRFTSRAVAA